MRSSQHAAVLRNTISEASGYCTLRRRLENVREELAPTTAALVKTRINMATGGIVYDSALTRQEFARLICADGAESVY
jgi:hypothetical protein